MPSRAQDWLNQGKWDLELARRALEGGSYEWACFAVQQAAEKAVKGMYQKLGAEAWGHAVLDLLNLLPTELSVPEELLDMARELDQYYIPTRYPNAHPQGTPHEYYTKGQAERAIQHTEHIIRFCEGVLAG